MNCPRCTSKAYVINSRENKNGRYRRYECKECKYRFSTIEVELMEGEPTSLVSHALGLLRGRIRAQDLAPTPATGRGARGAQ